MLCALIMAGGKGTRFWPLSTEEKPKQFLNLIDNETMIQMTVNRIRNIIPIERIFVCTGEMYIDLVKEQLPELPIKNIIVEPIGRNTTPCIALSALVINRYYKDSTMVVLPSDHLIKEEEEFRQIIISSNKFAENNHDAIITLGMNPTRAETGFGYIKCGAKIQEIDRHHIIKVERFVEKPNMEKAEEYLKEGSYLWNGGMFLWHVNNIINHIKKYSPYTYEALCEIDNIKEENLQEYVNKNYKKTEAISIDYSVLEKSKDIYVIPSDIGWDDVGSWKSIERVKKKDVNDNIHNENVEIIDSKSNLIINNEKKIVMIGIKDIMALETAETIFLVNKEYLDKLNNYQDIF